MSNGTVTPPAAREPTLPEIRRILALVEGHFDEAAGRYLGGYSDERVAQELDLPRAMVVQIRDESGMKLKGNPEILALRADIDTLTALLRGCEERLQRLEKTGR